LRPRVVLHRTLPRGDPDTIGDHVGDRLDPELRRAPGVTTGPVGQWMYLHRRDLRIGAVALADLIFVFWG
jgi:hypothetical protein